VVNFDVGRVEIRDQMGKLLAPQKPWGEWAPKIAGDGDDTRQHGGMRSLSMMQIPREDGFVGSITAKIEPSLMSSLKLQGIFMEINDHFTLGEAETILGSDAAMEILESQWSRSQENSEWIIDQMMALAESLK
jgi:hypothetical protein